MRLLFFLVATLVSATAAAATLHIHFADLKPGQGHLLISVYANAVHYRDHKHAVAQKRIAVTHKNTTADVALNLPPGRYAIEAMQDVNDDGKLNTNFMHIPTEPTGCSRNPHPWRRPHFDECAFKLPPGGRSIAIQMR